MRICFIIYIHEGFQVRPHLHVLMTFTICITLGTAKDILGSVALQFKTFPNLANQPNHELG